MKTINIFAPKRLFIHCLLIFSAFSLNAQLQVSYSDNTRVVNMIPLTQSGETWQDSEPNIAVDPSNTNRIIGSAFTQNPTGSTNTAPIYTSVDGGNTWNLNNIVPSGNVGFTAGMTGDISIKFNDSGGRLYAGILRGGSPTRTMDILATNNPYGVANMNLLSTRALPDQPVIKVKSTNVGGSTVDRVYVSNNDLGVPGSQTATIDISANGSAAAPVFNINRIEFRVPVGQDSPPVRTAVNADGTVYSVYHSRTSTSGVNRIGDIVVVRDDNWGIGATPFMNLLDPGDGNPGIRVIQNVNMPFINGNGLGSERIGADLTIAVDPNNSSTVYIAFAQRLGANDNTLRVRRTTDSGLNWSGDLLTITNAVNPTLAINTDGEIGFLYQQLVPDGGNQNWETHFRKSVDGFKWDDSILSIFQDGVPARTFRPYIGDYADLMSVGKDFFGTFSAGNLPDNNNFPQGITFQRNANFTTNQLTDNVGNPVGVSIDPFFFEVAETLSINCHADISVNNDAGDCGAMVAFPTPGPGDIPPGVVVVCNPPSGSFFPVGNTIVTCTATDNFGNSASCTFNVTVTDNEDPMITCPAEANASCEAIDPAVTGTPTVSDNCGLGPVTHSDAITPGDCLGNYTILRTWSVTDIHGNSSSCDQTVNVTDTTAPVVSCPDNIVVTCDTTTANTGMATALDNCDPSPVLTYSDNLDFGDCEWNCQIIRTWSGTDDCGNVGTCEQIIEKDVTPLIEQALKADADGDGTQDDLVLGVTQTTVTINPDNAPCVVVWMPPVGSQPTALKRQKATVDIDCNPGVNPRNTDGKIENPLFGEVLKLSIYTRLDPSFAETPLSELDCDIAEIVLQTVRKGNGHNPQVKHLLRVANIALGNLVLVPFLNELLEAMECINGPLDICDIEDLTN